MYKRGNRRIGNVVKENAPQNKIKSSRKRNHEEEEAKDGEVNNIMPYNEAMQVQPSVESSVATISGPRFGRAELMKKFKIDEHDFIFFLLRLMTFVLQFQFLRH